MDHLNGLKKLINHFFSMCIKFPSRYLMVTVVVLFYSGALIFPVMVVSQAPHPTIAISKASANYIKWLVRADSTIRWRDMYPLTIQEALNELSQSDGLLLTGGEDVFPGYYGKTEDTARCTEMNRHRDSLDMELIRKALEMKIPVMAVCRGHQILNVCLGGTLIIDIPADVSEPITHQCDDYLHCFHDVQVLPGTVLAKITGARQAEVTTNHHQAIEKLAPPLRATAFSADHLTEAVEWKEPDGKPFLIGVQWHPERMDEDNPLSGKIACSFIEHSRHYYQRKKQ
jgi:putative glutamine amidotransferase